MMIPQVAKRLIEMYGKDKEVLLDPFMGSGTALLEATLHKNFKKAYGIDINPLALLIAKVKTTPINPEKVKEEYKKLMMRCNSGKKAVNFRQKEIEKPNFFNIEFWFKPKVITDLAIIKENINKIEDDNIKDFFLIAFSETVRNVSNTRNSEYKLYRMSQTMLLKHIPDTFEEFKNKASKNIASMEEYHREHNPKCDVSIFAEDTRNLTSIPANSVDLIVTSPPYGDSRTTVAYGQFSRLGLQWLGHDKNSVLGIDKTSLGGIPTKDLSNGLDSATLKKTLNKIAEIDPKRAKDVLSFYVDFDKCIKDKKGCFFMFCSWKQNRKGCSNPNR